MAFSQLATPDPTGSALGLGAGDTGSYVYAPDVGTEGGRIPEHSTIPATSLVPVKSTFTVYEYGNKIPYTGKLKDLSKINVEEVHIRSLRNDHQKAWNTNAYSVFDDTYWRYCCSSVVADREFVINNTPTKTQNIDLDLANLGKLHALAETNNIPYWDGESYMVVIHPYTHEALTSDSTVATLLSRDSGRAALNGELGRVRNCRLIKDNHKLATTGAAGYYEFFLVGADAVVEELSLPIEIRKQDDDFGRLLEIAWYVIGNHFKPLNATSHTKEHIIRAGSAA
jgi:hypothetical protein